MSNCANLEIYEPYKKGAISSFVQSGNFEILTLTGFEPTTLRVAVSHLTHYTKFPYENILKYIERILILLKKVWFRITSKPKESLDSKYSLLHETKHFLD